ncbi:hypothetical protein [Marinobacter sediminicola]|uniref:hypothetical protein n=1 Tax=Marinobacter sediminicola TaxID=3072994 RepID=UPI002811E2BB|nr:hypothetical protein [Marinobacter sp. F26243]
MSNLQTGPAMHRLHQRLLAYPEGSAPQGQDLLALMHDLVYLLSPEVTGAELAPLARLPQCQPDAIPARRPSTLILMLWLLTDPVFQKPVLNAAELVGLLLSADTLMAGAYPDLQDEDQREELIRLTLNGLRLKPQDETDTQARDRLLMVSSSERARVIAASRAAEERAEAIRQALAEKRAREAADKYTRE